MVVVSSLMDVRNYIGAERYLSVLGGTLTKAGLENEVLGVLNASMDRADCALEILNQASGQSGAIHSLTGMLRFDPSSTRVLRYHPSC